MHILTFRAGAKDNIRRARSCLRIAPKHSLDSSRAPRVPRRCKSRPGRHPPAAAGARPRAAEKQPGSRETRRGPRPQRLPWHRATRDLGRGALRLLGVAARSGVPGDGFRERNPRSAAGASDRPTIACARARLPAAKARCARSLRRAEGRHARSLCAHRCKSSAKRAPLATGCRGHAHRLSEQLRRLLEARLVVEGASLPPLRTFSPSRAAIRPVQDDAGSDGESDHPTRTRDCVKGPARARAAG